MNYVTSYLLFRWNMERKEKNRLAAHKCRHKKKAWMQELERRSLESCETNRQLQVMIEQLEVEMEFYKNLLLLHNTCDCRFSITANILCCPSDNSIYL